MARKLFETPPDTPPEVVCRTFKIPSSYHWLGIFNKAILTLLNEYNWEQVNDTDLTIEGTIALIKPMIEEYWDTQECCEPDACLLPDGSRVLRLSISGHFEQLANGGWIPPTGDYEVPPVPARGEGTPIDRRCAAAANAQNVLQLTYEVVTDASAEGLTVAETAVELATTLTLLVAPFLGFVVPAMIVLLEAFIFALLEIAEFMTSDYWDVEFSEMLTCILFDCSTDDSDVVTFDYDCVLEGLTTTVDLLNPQAQSQLLLFGQVRYLLAIIGVDGLNAAGATTEIDDANCDACGGWCRQMLSSDGTEFIEMVAGTITVEDWIRADTLVGAQQMARFKIPLDADAQLNSVYVRIVDNGGFPRVTLMHNDTVWTGANEIATWVAGAEPFHTFTGFSPVSGGYLGIQINANDPAQTVMDDIILSSDILGSENPFGDDNC